MYKSIKWFSIVEIITTTAIIAVLAIIWFTFSSNYQSNQYNSTRVADLTAIYNLLQTNYTQNKTFPDPNWNKQYYDKNWTYAHGSDWAFWVSWFLTQKTLSKDKMWYPFMDGQTKNYYAYGKRLDWNSGYNLATVLNDKWEYLSYVVWDIGWNRMELAGLVKEYSGPNFVTSKSKYLPYNPYELKLTWKVSVYSGSISILDDNWNTIASNTSWNILDSEIEKWNTVKVSLGWLTTINLSDGTELKLGSTSQDSILNFSDLEYKDNSNLLTKVMLNLSLWEIWVKAPQLETDSSFEITNDNVAASVRWTIFWMTSNATSWKISLIEWKLEVNKISDNSPLFTTNNTASWLIYENGISYLEVKDSIKPVDFNYTTSTSVEISTAKILDVETPQLKFNSGIIPNVTSLIRNSDKLTITVDNIWADYIEIIWSIYWEQKDFTGATISPTSNVVNILNINWPNWSTNYAIKLCKKIIEWKMSCTWEFIQRTSGQSIDEPTINNYKKNASNFNTSCEKWKKPFKNFGCFENNLVAYAPYNESGDIYMNTDNWDILWFETVMVVSKNYMSWTYTKLEDTKTLKTNLLPKIWGLNYTPYYNTYNSIFESSSEDTSRLTANFVTPLWLVKYNSWTSFMSYPGWNWGIFIDNDWVEYIKYNLKELNLKDKFSIEMSVRGGALNRMDNKYYKLFTLWSWTNILSLDKVNNYLSLWAPPGYKTVSINLSPKFDSNSFYKVLLKINSTKRSLEILDLKSNILYSWIESSGNIISLFSNDLYIWSLSSTSSSKQWNDIIDYVKIYKN